MEARDCCDGIDRFTLFGTFYEKDGVIGLAARKQYSNYGWDWDCRLTPFGLVGFWGKWNRSEQRMLRRGVVWLWKEEWI